MGQFVSWGNTTDLKKIKRICEYVRAKVNYERKPSCSTCQWSSIVQESISVASQNHFHYWFWDLGCDPSLILTEHATLTYLSFLEYSLDNHKMKELDKESHFLEQTYTVSIIKKYLNESLFSLFTNQNCSTGKFQLPSGLSKPDSHAQKTLLKTLKSWKK